MTTNRRWRVTLETSYDDGRSPTRGEYCAQAPTERAAIDQAMFDRWGDDDYAIAKVLFLGIREVFDSPVFIHHGARA